MQIAGARGRVHYNEWFWEVATHVCGAGESLVKAQKSHSVNNGQVTY